jgi:hypothetical protein
LISVFQKHPLKDKPVIDYEFCLLVEPIIFLGTMVG